MKLDRRAFIKLVVGAAAGIHLTPIPWRLMDDVSIWTQNWPWVPRLTRYPGLAYASTVCTLCPGGCGVKVRVVDKQRVVKVEGLPGSPLNQGKVCPLGAAGPQYQYSLARIHGPLKRFGARGSGAWSKTTWSEAYKELGTKLAELRKNNLAQTVVMISGRHDKLGRMTAQRFMAAYGSPNLVTMPGLEENRNMANLAQFGTEKVGYDLEKSRLVLSFGCGLLEGWPAPVRTIQAFSRWRSGPKTTKLVQIESRASLTASKADQWLAVIPGTEGALALGLAHVIIKEGLYNKEFVAKNSFGFDQFQALVLAAYGPDKVTAVTGVPEAQIGALAREFAKTEKAVALAGRGKGGLATPVYELMAVMALNALVGNINQPGGVILRKETPLAPWPPLNPDKEAQAGLATPRPDSALGARYPLTTSLLTNLVEAINSGHATVNVLILDQANPAYFGADPTAFRAALARIPLVVSLSSAADDSTVQADLVLPQTANFEGPVDMGTPPGLPYPLFGTAGQVVKSTFDTKPAVDIYLGLAKAVGKPVEEAFPFKSYAELLKKCSVDLLASKKGVVATGDKPAPEEIFGGEVKPATFADDKAFQKAMANGLFWYDPAFTPGDPGSAFKTQSGKFEFLSQSVQAALGSFIAEKGEAQAMSLLGLTQKAELAALPHFEPTMPKGHDEKFPLLMVPVEQFKLVTGSLGNAPYLTKLLEDVTLKENDLVVELNPRTAAAHHLREGDRAWLQTPKGRLKVRLHLFEGARPDVVYAPVGLGHVGFDLYLRGKGVNPMDIAEAWPDPLSGRALWWGTRARLSKV